MAISFPAWAIKDEPFTLFTKDLYTYYGMLAVNCVGVVGWLFNTWWSYKTKLADKTQETLEMLMRKMDDLSKDVHFLSASSVSKVEVTSLIREELSYREKIRG